MATPLVLEGFEGVCQVPKSCVEQLAQLRAVWEESASTASSFFECRAINLGKQGVVQCAVITRESTRGQPRQGVWVSFSLRSFHVIAAIYLPGSMSHQPGCHEAGILQCPKRCQPQGTPRAPCELSALILSLSAQPLPWPRFPSLYRAG